MYNILEQINIKKIGEMVNSDCPVICFYGGDTYDGWIHETYRVTNEGLTLEIWESGGYESNQIDEDEHIIETENLIDRIKKGDIPLPRWSNMSGLKYLNDLINNHLQKFSRDFENLRNACFSMVGAETDPTKIWAIASIFGLE